jgi:putative FmdB family regulatory protein
MPLYEYACQKCEHEFEALVHGDEKVECPKCESTKLRKLLSTPGAPRVKSAQMKMACNSDGPPCGPACSRFS